MNKYDYFEEFIKKVFKNIDGVHLINLDEKINCTIYHPDFMFEFKNEKYCVEVKSKFSPNLFGRILENFNLFIKRENYHGIIVIVDKISDSYKDIIKKQYNIEVYDISNILYLIYDNIVLQKELNKLIEFSLDEITPREVNISYTKKSSAKKEKKDYLEKLEIIESGKEDAKEYEKLLEKIIKDIFSNELALFQRQIRTEDGINIFDMICKIKNDINDDFFSILEKFYKTKYILFEFKNYKEPIKQGQICTTEKYLFNTALRNVAIIITRNGADKNGIKLAKGVLRESGKLILIVDDNDLKEMIKLNENGEKSSIVLTRKLDELLTKLEK